MRPAIHPDDAIGAPVQPFDREGDELMSDGMVAPHDAHLRPRAAQRIHPGMRLRHALGQRQNRRVPRLRLLPYRRVDRQTCVIAKLRAGQTMRLVLGDLGSPFTRNRDLSSGIHLGHRRRGGTCAEHKYRDG